MDPKTMTTKQYVADVVEVTKYLCKRFSQEKVYLMAHSFGSYIGLNAIAKAPELYHAYFSMSQMCNQIESEILAYDYMLAYYQGEDVCTKDTGRYEVQKKYYEFLTAPQKNFYTFEKSAHSPLFEENEKALVIIQEICP